jgi:hypothetical protein
MRKHLALIASAALLVSTGIAAAQSQAPRNYDSSGAPKSSGSSPRSGGGLAGTTGSGSASDTTGAPNTPQAGDRSSGTPSMEKGSGNSSVPSGGSR